MKERYSRNIPALSEDECSLLAGKRVAVIGCGGLGGYIIEYLARLGIGHITAVDGDVFETSNLNRQLLSDTSLLGKNKAECASRRIEHINPDVDVRVVSAFLDNDNAGSIIEGCDIVMDALDNITARKILSAACAGLGIPLVYGAISGWIVQCAVSAPGDGLIETLFAQDELKLDKSALSFTPALCAAMQSALCTRFLCSRDVKSGEIYYFDLLNMEFETIPLL